MLERLINRYHQLVGKKHNAEQSIVRLGTEVAIAKGRLNLKPEVNEFMGLLQDKIHRRSVGKIEAMLTSILGDVFPATENSEADKIKILLSSKRQETSIKIMVTNGEYLEDVINGRGGSVTNVLSTGLRFIALARSGLTPFIVLDEADCWLKPEKIPAFMGVICQLAEKLKIQALVITHHDVDVVKKSATLLRLTRQGKQVSVQKTNSKEPIWDDGPGIREIRLKNFMSHTDTTIPLSPGVTILSGDNDGGKSAVVMALRAALYGESDESVIQHGKDRCEVALSLGSQGLLSFSRVVKGSRKCRYALIKNKRVIHESIEAKQPQWISDLGYGKKDKLDIQLGHQKQPVFLLNEPGSQKAAILSVGMESKHFGTMENCYKEMLKKDNDIARAGEKEINLLTQQTKQLKNLEPLEQTINELKLNINKINDTTEQIDVIETKINHIVHLKERSAGINPSRLKTIPQMPTLNDNGALTPIISKVGKLIGRTAGINLNRLDSLPTTAPQLHDNNYLKPIIDKVEQLTSSTTGINLGRLESMPPIPQLYNNNDLKQSGRALVKLNKTINVNTQLQAIPIPPQLSDNTQLNKAIHSDINAKQKQLNNECTQINQEIDASNEEIKKIIEEHNNECLLCGQFVDLNTLNNHTTCNTPHI